MNERNRMNLVSLLVGLAGILMFFLQAVTDFGQFFLLLGIGFVVTSFLIPYLFFRKK